MVLPPGASGAVPGNVTANGGPTAPGPTAQGNGVAGASPSGAAGTPANRGAAGAMSGAGGAPGMMMGGAAGATGPASAVDPMTGELIAPAAGHGIQIVTTQFDLAPGQEVYRCYHSTIPVDGEIDVAYYESLMAPGSHHFILYKNDGDTAPDGTLDPTMCTQGPPYSNWIYSSAQPHSDLRMPDGVAMVLSSRQRVVFDSHYINTTQQTLHVKIALNVNLAQPGTFQKAQSLVSFNTGIFIPPNGTQTVEGDCMPGAGAKFFVMLTHTHKRGTLATISRVLANGQTGEELVRTTDWDHPTTKTWGPPSFLTFQPGEMFHYTCSYMNDRDSVVTVGTSADANEMCMAITYYFPSSAGGSCN